MSLFSAMRKALILTSFMMLALTFSWSAFADNGAPSSKWEKVSTGKESGRTRSNDEIEDAESHDDISDEERDRISKNINSILIESYKAKFSKILGNLSDNIKNKTREEQIKILTSVLISTNSRIELIESGKVNIRKNRREVLLSLLKYIRKNLQDTLNELGGDKA